MKGIGGAALVLVAVVLYGFVAASIAWLMGSAAKLAGPEEDNPNQTEE